MLYNFFLRNLRMFAISRVFVPGKPIQPSMFVGKAGASLSEAPFKNNLNDSLSKLRSQITLVI
jgi:hypothetical protein